MHCHFVAVHKVLADPSMAEWVDSTTSEEQVNVARFCVARALTKSTFYFDLLAFRQSKSYRNVWKFRNKQTATEVFENSFDCCMLTQYTGIAIGKCCDGLWKKFLL